MRSIFVAAVAATSVLLANIAFADCTVAKRPLVTVAPTSPLGATVLIIEIGN
jgi:hypothetical protein